MQTSAEKRDLPKREGLVFLRRGSVCEVSTLHRPAIGIGIVRGVLGKHGMLLCHWDLEARAGLGHHTKNTGIVIILYNTVSCSFPC